MHLQITPLIQQNEELVHWSARAIALLFLTSGFKVDVLVSVFVKAVVVNLLPLLTIWESIYDKADHSHRVNVI
ncbi:MAG: hypothetical protein AB7V56_16710 [Candidatus Nitrosocosmicus sp.]|nr:hypothetical protein [Candidatus Nitrosocosmicus sp.]